MISNKGKIFPDLDIVIGFATEDETSSVQQNCTKRILNLVDGSFQLFHFANLRTFSHADEPQNSPMEVEISPFGKLRSNSLGISQV